MRNHMSFPSQKCKMVCLSVPVGNNNNKRQRTWDSVWLLGGRCFTKAAQLSDALCILGVVDIWRRPTKAAVVVDRNTRIEDVIIPILQKWSDAMQNFPRRYRRAKEDGKRGGVVGVIFPLGYHGSLSDWRSYSTFGLSHPYVWCICINVNMHVRTIE